MLFENPVLGLSVTGMLPVSRVVDGPVTLVPLSTSDRQKHECKRENLIEMGIRN